MSKEVISFLSKAHLPQQNQQAKNAKVEDVEFQEVGNAFSKGQVNTNQAAESDSGSNNVNQARQNSGMQQRPKLQPIIVQPKAGRNDKVEIKNLANGETKSMKFKQAEPLIKSGQWIIVGGE